MNKEDMFLFLNSSISLITLVGVVVIFLWLFLIYYFYKNNKVCYFLDFVKKYALYIGFVITFFGVFISLFYSEYLGFPPCGLCWFQRIMMYSQFVLFSVALFRKDFGILLYTSVLSILGIFIAFYQHYLQMGYSEFLPCPATGTIADCTKPLFVEYGFVTFPLVGGVMFIILVLVALSYKFYRK